MGVTRPLFVLGFDGLSPLFFEDCAPPLDTQYRGVLRSTDPYISPAAWASLLTGVTPDVHGIDRWRKPEWEGGPPSFGRSKAKPLWFGDARTWSLINVPCLYPMPRARNVQRFVGGMFWAEHQDYARPPFVLDALRAADYRIDSNGYEAIRAKDPHAAFRFLLDDARLQRRKVSVGRSDVSIVVYTFPDRVSHAFWADRSMMSEMHHAVKEEMGWWRSVMGGSDWIILSDHGFGPIDTPEHDALLRQIGEGRVSWMTGGHTREGVFMSNFLDLSGRSIDQVLPIALEAV